MWEGSQNHWEGKKQTNPEGNTHGSGESCQTFVGQLYWSSGLTKQG